MHVVSGVFKTVIHKHSSQHTDRISVINIPVLHSLHTHTHTLPTHTSHITHTHTSSSRPDTHGSAVIRPHACVQRRPCVFRERLATQDGLPRAGEDDITHRSSRGSALVLGTEGTPNPQTGRSFSQRDPFRTILCDFDSVTRFFCFGFYLFLYVC